MYLFKQAVFNGLLLRLHFCCFTSYFSVIYCDCHTWAWMQIWFLNFSIITYMYPVDLFKLLWTWSYSCFDIVRIHSYFTRLKQICITWTLSALSSLYHIKFIILIAFSYRDTNNNSSSSQYSTKCFPVIKDTLTQRNYLFDIFTIQLWVCFKQKFLSKLTCII